MNRKSRRTQRLSLMRRSLAFVAVVMFIGIGARTADALGLAPAGAVEPVYLSAHSPCGSGDATDSPARAFRDWRGLVHLFADHFESNRALIGPALNGVSRDCKIVYRGAGSRDPSAFDTWSWLTAFYTFDGKTVFALVHNEFHGDVFGVCPKGHPWACWYNAITAAISNDGGHSFTPAGPDRLVAAAPYRFKPDGTDRVGAFVPTNIVAAGNYFYVLFTFATPDVHGTCIMRTQTLADPASWRAWDGLDFTLQFVDPYWSNVRHPKAHECKALGELAYGGIGAVVRDERSNTFIAVQTITNNKSRDSGVYYSTSPDLIHWEPLKLLIALPTFKDFLCGKTRVSYGYGSLLDPASTSRNFDTLKDSPYLYLTRFGIVECHIGPERDFVRIPLKVLR